ncbi:MAG: AgmX/PglI C-terminal domain-containing protein [Sandaracinaceae bacterium]|nr:AgmX/PglI C-terminal domain-containing protein [Sandaracinaceae bacterium]
MDASNETSWGITASAPPINPAEVETSDSAVEVVVMWGENVLHVEHVSPPRDVVIEQVGDVAEAFPAVVEQGGRLFCVLPAGATGTVRAGDATKTFAELQEEGKLTPYADLAGASLYPLPDGATAQIDHAGLSVVVRPTFAGKSIAAAAPVVWRRYAWVGVSVGVHALFLVMFYFMPPHTSALSLDTVSATDRMVQYLDAAPEVVPEEPVEWEADSTESAGDAGQAHEGESGDSGRDDAPQTNRRFAIRGSDETPEMARERIRENIATSSTIGTVAALMGSWNVPTSPFGADQAHGFDDTNALGELMGDAQGDSFGTYGLGMRGTGRGAGGTGQGTYGVGNLGTIGSCGRGRDCGHGNGTGRYGHGVGALRQRRGADVSPISGNAVVRGGLSREAIRRVVRRNLNQVRFCYEQGLSTNPSIEGRVVVSWTVDGNGVVQASTVASSTLANASVESCIANAVRRWSFPQPDGGMPVGVNYPFLLTSDQ